MKNNLSSCRDYIETELARNNFIDGNLSLTHGFLPENSPIDNLPPDFHAWEIQASSIPKLFFSNRTQIELEQMPILDADLLDDEFLPRAATILSLLASAYWRHGLSNYLTARNKIEHASLPQSIKIPWEKTCLRLQRSPLPYQSGADLFFNNFKLKHEVDYRLENIKIENLDVLVPSFKNEPERIFYMSFVEIHAVTSPVVQLICEIEDLVNDQYACLTHRIVCVSKKIDEISATITKATRAFLKISPVNKSKTYCDPITWSKTVGIFALPPSNYPQGGTSGTSTPMLHVLDALISRHKYESYYGDYVKNHGFRLLDIKTKGFVQRVANLRLKEWIKHLPESNSKLAVTNSYNGLIKEYAGKDGFLDKHISKVFNYLAVATLSGRNQSTSGHERYISSETWSEVCDNLKIAITERTPTKIAEEKEIEEYVNDNLTPISLNQLAKHYKEEDGWILINRTIYDVTKFIQYHPGGVEILKSYLGRNCTDAFNSIPAHSSRKIDNILKKYEIGKLADQIESQSFLKHEDLIYYLQKTYAILNMNIDKSNDLRTQLILKLQTYRLFREDQLNHIRTSLNIDYVEADKNEIEIFVETQNLNQTGQIPLLDMLQSTNQLIENGKILVQELLDEILHEPVCRDERLIEIIQTFQNDKILRRVA